MTLRAWQEQLSSFVQSKQSEYLLSSHNEGFGNDVLQGYSKSRLAVYRSNYVSGLCSMLLITYPNIAELVGRECFEQLAFDFIETNPYTQCDIDHYGSTFPSFLGKCIAQNQSLNNLPYLADAAKVDWLCNQSYYAAPTSVFDFTVFGKLAEPSQIVCKFTLAANIHMLSSSWPLLQLWQFYANTVSNISMAEGDMKYFVVQRPEFTAQLLEITSQDYFLLKNIAKGFHLHSIIRQDPSALVRFIENGWIDGFYI